MQENGMTPGTWVGLVLFTWALCLMIGPWALGFPVFFVLFTLATHKETMRRKKAKRMKRELRRQAINHNTQVLSDMYDERHPRP